MSFATLNDLVALVYGLNSLRVLWRLSRRWRSFWDDDLTPADLALAGELAFFVFIPLGVFLHEAGHALATWQVGGRVVEFQWRVFWGYIIPAGSFTPAEDWWISFSGNLVSIGLGLLPVPFLPRLTRPPWRELGYAFARQQLFYALVWYPALSALLGLGGDWMTIYDFSIAPFAQITLVVHLALLYGLWRLDGSAAAGRWRLARYPQAIDQVRALEAEAERRPGDPEPLAHLAHLCHQLGEGGLSRRYLSRAERLDRQAPAVLMARAIIAFDQRRYGAARAAAEAALQTELRPERRLRLHALLARLYVQRDQPQEALPHLEAALAQAPADSELLYWRAVTKRRLGRSDEARQDFQQAIRLAPNAAARDRAEQGLASLGAHR